MLRPYGMLLRQSAAGSRKREQAPALQRNVARSVNPVKMIYK
jgi:hypothetical protein